MGAVNILALDPGELFGFAWTPDRTIDLDRSGVWDLEPFPDPGQRFAHLDTLLTEHDSNAIVYERPVARLGISARSWHYGYLAITQAWCFRRRVPLYLLAPTRLKLYAVGKGNADKAKMAAAARKAFGLIMPVSSDQVDALWLLSWGLGHIDPGET